MTEVRCCLLVPHYNHVDQFATFLPQLCATGMPVLVVDDGSDSAEFARLEELLTDVENCTLFRLSENRGKGSAVIHGIVHAGELAYTHVLQIDADGQHTAQDCGKLTRLCEENPEAMISGLPVFGDDIPAARLQGRKLSLFMVRLETLSCEIQDAMCGFRVYPVSAMLAVAGKFGYSRRMQFDLEVLVRWLWSGRPLLFVETPVRYPEEGKSHFKMVRDNAQITLMHTQLVIGMLLRSPVLLWRRWFTGRSQ